jgi:predicted ferric reductase
MVASMLVVASLIWGVLLATRALKPLDRPAWLMAMHRWTSTLACIGIVLHVAALVGDNYLYFGWKEILVPMSSGWKPGPVTLGVVAMYLLILVQGTSLVMKRLPRRLWKFVHYFGYAAVWFTSVHAALSGSDVSNRLYQAVALVLTILTVTAAVIRVIMGTTRHQREARAAGTATR